MRAPLIGYVAAVFLAAVAVAENANDIILARAPSGAFSLIMKAEGGAIWLVPANAPERATALPPVRVTAREEGNWNAGLKEFSSDDVGDPTLTFISPDDRWIFVQMQIDHSYGIGFLYRRTNDEAASPVFELATAERLDVLAGRFFSAEANVPEQDLAVADSFGNREFRLHFGAWSADSTRLLLALSGGIGARKEPMGEFARTIGTWLCYFNTRTGSFELTERLRAANAGTLLKPAASLPEGEAAYAILDAESIGHEGMPGRPKLRFENADRELNDVYRRVLAASSPPAKAQLQAEQRRWLAQRALAGEIHANQSWSLFPGESRIEGEAIATEARVAELKTRLSEAP